MEIFYPAYKAAVSKREDTKLYHEALEEHHVVDTVIAEIKSCDSGSEEFSAKAKVLKDLVEHHAEEEEKQMFPRARSLDPSATYTEGVHLRDFGSMSLDAAIASEARFHTLMTQGAARVPAGVRARLSPADLFAAIRRAALETLCAQVAVP